MELGGWAKPENIPVDQRKFLFAINWRMGLPENKEILLNLAVCEGSTGKAFKARTLAYYDR